MRKLIDGLHDFRENVFRPRREFFEKLAEGQNPEVLFITCSDSRVNPALITQTQPGDLFIIRNAGNIVPARGPVISGEEATIEYAIAALDVDDIIICGHSHCGAMKAVVEPGGVDQMPAVATWLEHAQATRRILKENYADLSDMAKLNVAVQENVLVQIEHIRTLPSVSAALAKGKLRLHAWVYKMETGEVFAYDPAERQFAPITAVPVPAVGPSSSTPPI